MGVIFSNSFVAVANANITARSANASYPKINVMDNWHLSRCFRAADVTANDYLLKFNFGAAQSLSAILLRNVNFDTVKIQGHASDSWGSPSYAGSNLTVSQDPITGRYNIYIPITSFNYQYLRIFIPAGTSEVGTSISEWKIGNVLFMSSITTLSKNISYGYNDTGEQASKTISLPHGGAGESVELGDLTAWQGEVSFGYRAESDESELWTVNAMHAGKPIMFYLNDSDTSEAWLCKRDGNYKSTLIANGHVQGNSFRLTEII